MNDQELQKYNQVGLGQLRESHGSQPPPICFTDMADGMFDAFL